jgi:hypothetical protein
MTDRTPDLKETTVMVDTELKRLEDARREQGWTPWLLLATVAGLCWQLADYLAMSHDWERVGLYWGLLIVVGLAVEVVVSSLNFRDGPRRSGVRYFPSNLYAGSRSARLFMALKIGAAAALICWLTPMSGPVKFAWLVVYGFFVYMIFGHVAGSWTDIPHPVGTIEPKGKSSWFTSAIFWILYLGLVIIAVRGPWQRLVDTYNVADAKIALLAFGVAHLVGLLLAFAVNEPLRRELIHLRRLIGFGDIDATQARQKLFELIYGSELSVLLRPRFNELEKKLQEIGSLPDEAESAFMKATEGINRRQNFAEAREKVEQIQELFDAADSNWTGLQIRLTVCKFTGGVPDDVSQAADVMETKIRAVATRLESLKASIR